MMYNSYVANKGYTLGEREMDTYKQLKELSKKEKERRLHEVRDLGGS